MYCELYNRNVNRYSQQATTQTKSTWITDPHPGHLVHFYESESELLAPLTEYMRTGLVANETCIIIATQNHILALNEFLRTADFTSGQRPSPTTILAYDAEELLGKIMVGNLPDWNRFMDTIGLLIQNAQLLQKPVRAYGEMVAILWKSGHREAVMMLEDYWNQLLRMANFSLYCAYPKLQFIYDKDQMSCIDHHHGLHLTAAGIS